MKKLTKGVLAAVFGLILAVAGTAFTPAVEVERSSTDVYWKYSGSGPDTSPMNYEVVEDQNNLPGCNGSSEVCLILAPANPGNSDHPVIDEDLKTKIEQKDTSGGFVSLRQ